MTTRIDEFLYRGKPAGQAPAWHVVLANEVSDGMGGTITALKGPLNMTQAEDAGFPLPVIIASINSELLKNNELLRAENTAVKAENIDVKSNLAATQQELDHYKNSLQSVLELQATE